jgi:hypothetical protein
MAKQNVAQLSMKLYELLSLLDAEDRTKVIQATLILCGDTPSSEALSVGGNALQVGGSGEPEVNLSDVKAFFDAKDPRNKGEEFAVAARFRESAEHKHEHSKQDIESIITGARRNFDSTNYARDIKNARNQSGLFNKNTCKNVDKLSYYGQNYVDALPDREAVKKLRKPVKKSSPKKKSKAKKAAKTK